MGYIEYLKGGLDEQGNEKWYYQFFSNNKTDVTEYFNFLGRKVKLRYGDVILITKSPENVFKTLQQNKYINYVIPELEKSHKSVNSCSSGNGCSCFCDEQIMKYCTKLAKYEHLIRVNNLVREAICTDSKHYVSKGTKEEFDKKASKNLSYSSFESINTLNLKYDVPKYKITGIVNNGNTCELVDVTGKKHVIDIVMILRNIMELKIYIVNLNEIKNCKLFTA